MLDLSGSIGVISSEAYGGITATEESWNSWGASLTYCVTKVVTCMVCHLTHQILLTTTLSSKLWWVIALACH